MFRCRGAIGHSIVHSGNDFLHVALVKWFRHPFRGHYVCEGKGIVARESRKLNYLRMLIGLDLARISLRSDWKCAEFCKEGGLLIVQICFEIEVRSYMLQASQRVLTATW